MTTFARNGVLCERFILGPLEVNTYLLTDEGGTSRNTSLSGASGKGSARNTSLSGATGKGTEAILVDPADLDFSLLKKLEQTAWTRLTIFLTHCHADHIPAADEIRRRFGATMVCSEIDAPALGDPDLNLSSALGSGFTIQPPDRTISDGDTLTLGNHIGRVVSIPGHTPGGLALIFPGLAITGDTLFAGSIGRGDLPGGDGGLLIRSIMERLFTLDDEMIVLPGHGPETTVGQERQSNPFFRDPGNFLF